MLDQKEIFKSLCKWLKRPHKVIGGPWWLEPHSPALFQTPTDHEGREGLMLKCSFSLLLLLIADRKTEGGTKRAHLKFLGQVGSAWPPTCLSLSIQRVVPLVLKMEQGSTPPKLNFLPVGSGADIFKPSKGKSSSFFTASKDVCCQIRHQLLYLLPTPFKEVISGRSLQQKPKF